MTQLTLADALKQEGMKRAVDHADKTIEKWSERALESLKRFCLYHNTFLVEEVREWALKEGLSMAPSARAWGSVIVRAAKLGIVEQVGYAKTSNPNAHRTPASLWKSRL